MRGILASFLLVASLVLPACGGDSGGAAPADDATLADTAAPDTATPDTAVPDVSGDAQAVLPSSGDLPLRHVIVTPRALVPTFASLAAWRIRTGVGSTVVALEDALAGVQGRDDAERLRNWLKAYAAAHPDLAYVLLGGDEDTVPARRIHVWTDTYGQYETEDDAVTDFYFADLEGDWDQNHNGVFGEIDDGLAMRADLAVGRLPVDTVAEAQAVVMKLMAYEYSPPAGYLDRILLLSEPTGYYNIDSCLLLDAWSEQLLPADASYTKLYEADAANCHETQAHTPASELAAFAKGQGLVVHLGHGVESMLSYLDEGQVDGLANAPYYPVYVSCACYAGNFSGPSDSVGERWLTNPDGGGVAYLGNTSIGIGYPPGQRFIKFFLEGLFEAGRTRLGDTWRTALNGYPPAPVPIHDDGDCYRYTDFVLVLLGDPGMQLWRGEPGTLKVDLALQGSTATVTVTDEASGVAVEGASVVAQGGGVVTAGVTAASGKVALTVPAGVTAGGLELTVTAPDYRPAGVEALQ